MSAIVEICTLAARAALIAASIGMGIGIGIHRHGGDTHAMGGADDAPGDFTPIGNEQSLHTVYPAAQAGRGFLAMPISLDRMPSITSSAPPGGALVALDEHRVGPAHVAEVVGDGRADDPAADDEQVGREQALEVAEVARQPLGPRLPAQPLALARAGGGNYHRVDSRFAA